ncbi:MAG: glycosyltransferase family 4 protein [Melioribacteraceae bacterium]|nr:glycosyltransferase family 4 protein [Melioribacteraceae bacterium]
MKILFTCISNGWGGLEMFSLSILLQLKNLQHDVYLLTLKNSPLFNEAEKENIKVFSLSSENYLNLFSLIHIKKIFEKENFDIIHSHSSKDLWFIVPTLNYLKIKTPIHFTKHVASGISKKDFLHNWIYKRIDKVYAISEMIKKNIIETTTINEDKIILLYNGIDTEKFNPDLYNKNIFREEINVNEDEILIGMIGRISQGKGHEEFLKSADILLKKYSNLKFVIVGHPSIGEENYYKGIVHLAKSINQNKKIVFTGLRKDTPNILAALDIFVFPSHDESFGLTLIEAMSMKKANVCTRASGVLEIAVEDQTSLFFNKADVNELVDKITILIESIDLRFKLGENSRKRVLDKFDFKNYINSLINYYNKSIE